MSVTDYIPPDVTPPIITAPVDVTFEATSLFTAVPLGMATATDNTDSNVIITHNAPGSFPLGKTIVTWTTIDNAGNSANTTQSVIVADTIPPVFAEISDYTVTGNDLRFPINYTTPTATDNVDDNVTVHCNPSKINKIGANEIHCFELPLYCHQKYLLILI